MGPDPITTASTASTTPFFPAVALAELGYVSTVSRNEIVIDASPDAVYQVLCDAHCYPRWVVGARRIRDVDGNFPEPGSRFHHAVGIGPLELRDHTEVIETEPGRRVVLRARARPATVASIDLRLEPSGDGTTVVMFEEAERGPARMLPQPVRDFLLVLRNSWSLARLKRLVERRAASPVL